MATEKEISRICPATSYRYKLGCAFPDHPRQPDGSWGKCRVVIVADNVLAKAGFTLEVVYRHEMGHCNGWPGDHLGARFAPLPLARDEMPDSVKRGLGRIP